MRVQDYRLNFPVYYFPLLRETFLLKEVSSSELGQKLRIDSRACDVSSSKSVRSQCFAIGILEIKVQVNCRRTIRNNGDVVCRCLSRVFRFDRGSNEGTSEAACDPRRAGISVVRKIEAKINGSGCSVRK